MFKLKKYITEAYDNTDKKIPLERFRSECFKYINKELPILVTRSLTHNYSAIGKYEGVDLPDLLYNTHINSNQWEIAAELDKPELIKAAYNKLHNDLHNIDNLINIVDVLHNSLGENDFENIQIKLESDIQNFIETDFKNYINKSNKIGRK